MDFSFSEEQVMFRDLFRSFADKEVLKHAEHVDKAEALNADTLKKAAEQGFFAALIPEEFGGAAFDMLSYTLLIEEVSKHCLSTGVALALHNSLVAAPLVKFGTPAQKETYLPLLAGGDFGALALTEPEAGSDAGTVATRATRNDTGYHFDGVKTWVSNAGPARLFIVLAVTAPKTLTAFLVERDQPWLTVGGREPTLGLRGLDIRTLYLEGGPLPAENVLGAEGQGAEIVAYAHTQARLALAAAALGAAEGALELGIRFAAERKQFNTQIVHKQAIQNYFADVHADIESLRLQVHYAAWLAQSGQPFDHAANLAKYLGARVAKDAANKMLQVHGGYGFSDEYPISRYHRDVRALRVLGGTDEVQRFYIARQVLNERGIVIQP